MHSRSWSAPTGAADRTRENSLTRSRPRSRSAPTTSSSTCSGCADGSLVRCPRPRRRRAARRCCATTRRSTCSPAGPGPHLDLKFVSPRRGTTRSTACEVDAGSAPSTARSPDRHHDDDRVRAVRDWADARGPRAAGRALARPRRRRASRCWQAIQVRALGALAARALPPLAGQRRGRAPLARPARRRAGSPAASGCRCSCGPSTPRTSLRYWMRPGRAWLVTTNEPEPSPCASARG